MERLRLVVFFYEAFFLQFEPISTNNDSRQSPMYDQEPAYQADADRLAPAARVFGDNVVSVL